MELNSGSQKPESDSAMPRPQRNEDDQLYTPASTPERQRVHTPPESPGHDEEELPPPAYHEATNDSSGRNRRFSYGNLQVNDPSISTDAQVDAEGRVSIRINEKSSQISNLLAPALRSQLSFLGRVGTGLRPDAVPTHPRPEVLEQFKDTLRLNIVIQIIGSRGDVQPFVALTKVLQAAPYHHRVRIATHAAFKEFVEENGVEFFCIGGDPAELMAYMVRNPGLMPGVETLKSGEVQKRRRAMAQMLEGEWKSCVEAGDGMGGRGEPFVADAIIANPPSFGHIHCAERLGVRLHIMFTMPWSATQAFPHPLANISSSNMDIPMTNYLSYILVEMMTWQGLGDVVNRFRQKVLGIDAVSTMWAPTIIQRLKIPHTYCWSPALIPKPQDWGEHIDVSGFYFLSLSSSYQSPADLQQFLDAGPPPVYIGFGSIVVDDPNGLTTMILEAIKLAGVRAIVSKGWGGLGSNSLDIPENVFLLGNCPHDWLFKHVSAVVHHGGAGTTAIGLTMGCPTVIVPFFGDQPFWGAMVQKRGVGPAPIPFKELTAQNLAAAIKEALLPDTKQKAKALSEAILHETGVVNGAASFSRELDADTMRSDVDPSRVAVFVWKRYKIKLSARAAELLIATELIDRKDIRLHRHIKWQADEGPIEPITGGASALLGTIGSIMMGVGDFPVQVFKGVDFGAKKGKEKVDEVRQTLDVPLTGITSRSSTTELPAALPSSSAPKKEAGPAITPTPSTPRTSAEEPRTNTSTPPDAESAEATKKGKGKKKSEGNEEKATLKDLINGQRATENIVVAGLRSPLDFTLALAKGFHNAPLLYGDNTVRPQQHVTGMKSGLKAAFKGVGYGLYDGITGLVNHPIDGARKEGASGFIKGVGKGIGGIVLKPGAGFWGVPGYTMAGLDKEIGKLFGNPIDANIMVHHFNRGIEEAALLSPTERNEIVEAFLELQEKKQEKHSHSFSNLNVPRPKIPRVLSHLSHRSASPNPSTPSIPFAYSSSHNLRPTVPPRSPQDMQYSNDLSNAIAASVRETSTGNPEEDELIARAIAASIEELGRGRDLNAVATRVREETGGQWDEEEMKRAIELSLKESSRNG